MQKDRKKIKKTAKLLCPICDEKSDFVLDVVLGVLRCSRCKISENDFYVKKLNNLWG